MPESVKTFSFSHLRGSAARVAWLGGVCAAAFAMPASHAQSRPDGTQSAVHAKHKVTPKHSVRKRVGRSTPVKAANPAGAPVAGAATPVTVAAPAAAAATGAFAVGDTDTGRSEQIVVTGARLSHSRLTDVMAGQTVTAEQIKARGYTNLGLALLRENPAFAPSGNSQIGSQGSFGAGQTFGNLLNLGDQRTLTLIDGMRMVGATTPSIFATATGSQVDVGTIPVSLVKQVDTKIGGAGAAYGADAVAGVVNYILDDKFEGLDFNAQGQFTQKLDAPQEQVYLKYGRSFDHEKGHVVFDIEYRNAGGMTYRDRNDILGADAEAYRQPLAGSGSPYSYVFTSRQRFAQTSVNGIPLVYGTRNPTSGGKISGGIASATGSAFPLEFSDNGTALIPLTYEARTGSNNYVVGGNGISLRNYQQLFTPSDSLNLTTLGTYDITPRIHASWQGWYQRGSAESTTAQGYWSTSQFDEPLTLANFENDGAVNGPFALSTSNPYLTGAERTTIINALKAAGRDPSTFYMTRLNQDLDAGAFKTLNQMFRFQGGLNGDFDALHRNFQWKVVGQYSKYLNDTSEKMVDTRNLINALDAVVLADGTIGCRPGVINSTAVTESSTCAPLDPFGFDQMTPAAKQYVTADAVSKTRNDLRDIQAELSSSLFHLPAGDVRWDLGYEHRRESYDFDPGAFMRGELQPDGSYSRYGNFIPISGVNGAYQTHEAFGELDLPIVSPKMHIPAIYSLSAQANGRFTHNSASGNYWTYLFGGAWWPTQDFGFSGNYAKSVRNPSVNELYSPLGSSYESANDPCSQEFLNSGPNPATRRANCAKAGIPTNFESDIVSYTILGATGGNTRLKNESSKSYTGSLHLAPRFLSSFRMDASFNDVKINDEIQSLTVEDEMSACYDSPSYPNAYCSTFVRDPSTHQITYFEDGYTNIAQQHLQALTASVSYALPLRRVGLPNNAGDLLLNVNYIHYLKNQQTLLGVTYQEGGSTATPNDSFVANLNYVRGPFFAQWQTIWYGPSVYELNVADNIYQGNNRSAFAYFNTTLGYKITKNFDVNFNMNNVTDALPKHAGTVSLTRYYEALLGRSFLISIGAHF
jgi:iron complex outermembrane recepter protein